MDRNPDVELALRYCGYYERQREASELVLRHAVERSMDRRAAEEAWQRARRRQEDRRLLLAVAAVLAMVTSIVAIWVW